MEGNPESERFVQVAQAEDPFTADALEAVLKRAGMSVLRTDHPGGSGVDALGTGWALPWFELSVLEENVARARQLVEVERQRLAEEAPRRSARPRTRSGSRRAPSRRGPGATPQARGASRRRPPPGRGSRISQSETPCTFQV